MPQPRPRQRVLRSENDENNSLETTRLTRAKASLSTSEEHVSLPAKKPLQTKKSSGNTLNGTQRRRALGDVTNAAKGNELVNDGKKATAGKAGLTSKAAQAATGGVQKLTRTNSSRSALGVRDANLKTKAATELKRPGSGSGILGTTQRKRTQTSTSTVQSSKEATPNIEEPPRKKSCTQEDVDEYDEIVADLDAEDLNDPSMCAEYVREIFEYYRELEKVTMPNANYMDHQDELEWKMRGILIDWLIEVHTRFRLLPETLFLAVNIVDRFLSQKIVPLDKLQLVGITAMFIASKYEEVLSPHVVNFVHVADDGFTVDEVLSAERYTLTTLKYDLSYPNPMNFLRRISKADNYDIQTRTVGKYLMEVSLVDHRFLQYRQSHIAAAAMYLARMCHERGPWDATLTKFAGYTEAEVLPLFELMIEYLQAPVAHEALFKKYASKKFMKVSIMVRKWAKEYYASVMAGGVTVDDVKAAQ